MKCHLHGNVSSNICLPQPQKKKEAKSLTPSRLFSWFPGDERDIKENEGIPGLSSSHILTSKDLGTFIREALFQESEPDRHVTQGTVINSHLAVAN